MRTRLLLVWLLPGLLALGFGGRLAAQDRFRVATYNLENYLLRASGDRPAKTPESRARVRATLHQIQADVLALQEIGSLGALQELRDALRAEGLDYPHWDLTWGADTNVHLGILSRFPMVRRQPHTNDTFLLRGRRLRVARGFAEAELEVNSSYRLTLLVAHLKSKRAAVDQDEEEIRYQEALLLRERVEELLRQNPKANLLVAGDLNDHRNSRSLRALLGRKEAAELTDARPVERDPTCASPVPRKGEPRAVAWTHYFAKEDTYSRFDYLLLSGGLTREWVWNGSYVLARHDWGQASDHRAVVAEFLARER